MLELSPAVAQVVVDVNKENKGEVLAGSKPTAAAAGQLPKPKLLSLVKCS